MVITIAVELPAKDAQVTTMLFSRHWLLTSELLRWFCAAMLPAMTNMRMDKITFLITLII